MHSMPSADSLRRAADLLAEGAREAAQTIVQDYPSKLAAWVHGIVHLLKGDDLERAVLVRVCGARLPASQEIEVRSWPLLEKNRLSFSGAP